MLHFQIIGNLGADAEVKQFNSGDYVSFRVAHNVKTEETNKTLWVSCLMRGNGGNLLQYLKKGQAVYVSGRGSARAFSSHITKQWEVGLDLQVDRIELLGGKPAITIETIKQALENGTLDRNQFNGEFLSF